MNNKTLLRIQDLKFGWRENQPLTLSIPALTIAQGEKVFLKGPSGSGKSTLLGLITGINQAASGSIEILGSEMTKLSNKAKDHFRADHLGYIFQQFNLLPYLSLIENVSLPCHFSQSRKAKALQLSGSLEQEAKRLLDHLEIPAALLHRPVTELSIGQQQRVAAARALIGRPAFLIADEPTSSLDTDARESFIKLLFNECDQADISLIFVSHDPSLQPLFSRHINLDEINLAAGAHNGHR
ncbi:ABC transporter ATP-binding protein [Motilimonas pumila]|uniref:ABC transporter ATP-binding protein n=1 Tax=Motilimonas pumila TaxID=2303987 RepID=A0A418YC18_9GAMM|nr:ABC transporter ATP-binding protein [Motilimonas pumila]RJG42058.1 ABC transporter ATP-binding protein [Motilimonas pumila]